MTMTKHSEQLARPAAELERLAEYYDTHDTGTEMDNGDLVEPQPMPLPPSACLPTCRSAQAAGANQACAVHRVRAGDP